MAVPADLAFLDQGTTEEDQIAVLVDLRDQLGEEALTDEEYRQLSDYERTAHTQTEGHHANLAEALDENDLKRIARDVIEWVQWDEDSREDWRNMERQGIRSLGVTPNVDGGAPFKGASKAVHPVLAEACVQFQSRAIESLWPAGGPVKTVVLGNKTPEHEEQARRVEQFMNYQYTELMPGSFEQVDNLLIRLPLSGSCFVKVYHDPIMGVCRRYIEPADFLVPYTCTDLDSAPRYTEQILTSKNDLRKRQVAGFYRDIDLVQPRERSGDSDRDIVTDEVDASEGRAESDVHFEDDRHTLYECYCEMDLPGHEDEADGELTGIALPYVVTVDRDSQEVLSVYRNWKPDDAQKKKVVYHIHYKYIPGLGFYGYGLYHWIGALARAATGSLRALLDAGLLSNMPGGYKSRDAKIPGGNAMIDPGEWKDVNATSEELAKAFFPLPFKEPSKVLYDLMGRLEELARRFAGTTDVLVGEGTSNTPVGTTLARIEQGSKVISAVQKRLHHAAGREYRLVAWLDSLYLPDEYPYAVAGEDRAVKKADFDSRVDVLPISDPNFVSHTQRYFISEASLEIAARNPELYDLYALHKRAQSTLRIENLDEILPNPEELTKRMSPVEENAALIQGLPVKAHIEQEHQAHLTVHQMFAEGLDAQQQNQIGPHLMAHIQEHMSMSYLLDMQQMTGVMYRMPDRQTMREDEWQDLPVETENQIAVLSAQAMLQARQATPQQPDPDVAEMQAEQGRKDRAAEADIRRKDSQTAADIERQAVKTLMDERNKFKSGARVPE